MKKYFKICLAWLLCFAVFGSTSYFYLRSTENKEADKPKEKIPYFQVPETQLVLLSLPSEDIMAELNFKHEILSLTRHCDKEKFDHFYTVEIDKSAVAGMIDRIGGIELTLGKKELRYTGIQVIQLMYSNDSGTEMLKSEVLKKFILKSAQGSLTRNDFIYLLENCKTDITVPDLFYWPQYIGKMCENVVYK